VSGTFVFPISPSATTCTEQAEMHLTNFCSWSGCSTTSFACILSRRAWRKFRIAPLIRSESAAIPAMPPSPWSRSCLREVEGAVPCTQLAPQHGAEASGCELCRIILEPGNVVTTDGGATGHELHDTCKSPPKCYHFRSLPKANTNFVMWNW
jgi:hypothetical protein